MPGTHNATAEEAADTQVCELCDQPFAEGDLMTPLVVTGEWGDDPYGLIDPNDDTSGAWYKKWVCAPCLLSQNG